MGAKKIWVQKQLLKDLTKWTGWRGKNVWEMDNLEHLAFGCFLFKNQTFLYTFSWQDESYILHVPFLWLTQI